MTIPLVSIVGTSNSGKTTLIEKLIAELKRRGYRVATIKHSRHVLEIDHEGKDSWRHRKAGASPAIAFSSSQIAIFDDIDRDYDIATIIHSYASKADIVLTEGFKGNPWPKIEVYRPELKRDRLTGPQDNLIALVVDSESGMDPEIPCFNPNDAVGIVDLISERLTLKKK